jgi:hypothetical protein
VLEVIDILTKMIDKQFKMVIQWCEETSEILKKIKGEKK